MPAVAPAWQLRVDRGPDGLWIRLGQPHPDCVEAPPLADLIWSLLERHFVYRLVLELDELELLNSALIGQLVLLHKRIGERGGLLRLSGLSAHNLQVLRLHGLDGRFPIYQSRVDAVMGGYPCRPR